MLSKNELKRLADKGIAAELGLIEFEGTLDWLKDVADIPKEQEDDLLGLMQDRADNLAVKLNKIF